MCLGVLHDALRFRARESVLNGIMGEIALQVAPFGADIRAAHVWSEKNETCDMLSRLKLGAQVPLRGLEDATQCTPRRISGTLLGEHV